MIQSLPTDPFAFNVDVKPLSRYIMHTKGLGSNTLFKDPIFGKCWNL